MKLESEPQLSIIQITDERSVEATRRIDHKGLGSVGGPFIAFNVFVTSVIDGRHQLVLHGGNVLTWLLDEETARELETEKWLGWSGPVSEAPEFIRIEIASDDGDLYLPPQPEAGAVTLVGA